MVRRIYELCLKGGIPCELEPRNFSSYKCTVCAESIQTERRHEHQRTCGTGALIRSGPDIVIHWASGDIYYDFTIVHELSPSNIGRKATQLMKDAIGRKIKTYVTTAMIPSNQFVCLPMLSGGAMHANTKALLNSLADVCGADRETIVGDFALQLQELNGAVVYSQLKQFLASDSSEEKKLF